MKTAAFLIALALPAAALAQTTPSAHGHSHGDEDTAAPAAAPQTPAQAHGHSHDGGDDAAARGPVKPKTTVPGTATSPEYLQLATNVEVIPNIEKVATSNLPILTHEGAFSPLLFAENNRAFLINLKPGMFLAEHPHPTGSIVYTVRGRWVLASEGKRQVMEAGSLFRFGDGMPTGWEAPFNEGALLLIVKGKQGREDYATFNNSIKSMQATVDKERKGGTAFYYNELKPNDPAIAFARSVNPNFDSVLKIKY